MRFEGPRPLGEQGSAEQGGTEVREDGELREKEPGFNLDFYVTDHSADSEETGSPEKLRELYTDIKKDGVESVRYDWRWKNIERKPGEYSKEHLERYGQAKQIMEEVGMKEPTIILSDLPDWAKELYRNDKEKFFDAYKSYVEQVRDVLQKSGGKKVSTVQILNELNNKQFTPVEVEDLPRMCTITREALHDYNPDIKLLGTLLASNTTRMVGIPIQRYLPEFKKVKDSFDRIAVDYYPGTWHLEPKVAEVLRMKSLMHLPSSIYKSMVKNTEFLGEVFREIATWGKEYEIGETGKQTFGENEKSQRYFYDAFFRAFKHMMVRMRRDGLPLPSRVGFYEAVDEGEGDDQVAKSLTEKIMAIPERHWGMRDDEGRRKMILQGSPHADAEARQQQPSQLRKIINYLRAPVND